jgi:hypothetical protein
MRHPAFTTSCAGGLASIVVAALLVLPAPALATGDANEAFCPNESLPGFQPYLPDCRAYEMVSPPFKDGAPNMQVRAVSNDGSRVIASSLGAFAGTEGDPIDHIQGAVYEFARSGSGWVASSVTPPASLSPGARFFGASADATRVLWEVLGSSKSVYSLDVDVREADGSFVKVGPLVAPVAGPPAGNIGGEKESGLDPAGASKDLSHVLFRIEAGDPALLWPGDTTTPGTSGSSLYEYVGTGNAHPMLVGVNEEGHLISDCETMIGSALLEGGGDAYNAVSVSGETVFFTALGRNVNNCEAAKVAPEVSELYARLDQLQSVTISEPSHGQCAECNTPATVAEGRRPAVFQGASEDGSKAFFLTEQELFKGDTATNLYEYDFNNPKGEKIVRVSGGSSEVQGVARVSEDGSHVYFVAKGVLAGVNAEGKSPVSGANNLYVFERDAAYPVGHTAFIATLSSETQAELKTAEEPCTVLSGEEKEECENRATRKFRERNEADQSDWRQSDERGVQATPDGRFLVFGSVADLTPGDTSIEGQVFEYDSLREKLVRVSIGAEGYPDGGANANANGSFIFGQDYAEQSLPTAPSTGLAVSADGAHVLFSSPGALTKGAETAAAAEAASVYEYHSVGSIENGNVYLISDGTNAFSAEMFGLDASGADAFFKTVDPLLPQDVDTHFDIYDARVDGGFPAPVAPAACEGEPCQGALSAPPSFGAPGSATVSGSGNLTPTPTPVTPKPKPKPVKCKKGFVKKHGRCKCKKGFVKKHGRCVRVKTPKKKTNTKRAKSHKGGK